ncbi:plasmid pRiA4b ORF-3 family protein [Comamonas faecalis]|uniref:Plasmid pRiA4b ORF-3 family protein n=1 Tax=Comamonas faecalis TaxID=1387849 RepID=A0ABP7QLV7_9BURK
MHLTTDTATPQAYLLRVTLRDIDPPVWRELWVDAGITLRQLHATLQAAMGWKNCHLHGFALPDKLPQLPRYWRVPALMRFEPEPLREESPPDERASDDARTRLRQVMRKAGDQLLYLYDFGDSWEHVLTLQQVAPASGPLPRLAGAALMCPPEDCGGVPGLVHWMDAWDDPGHPEHDDARALMRRLGRKNDPMELTPSRLATLRKRIALLRPPPQ